MKRTPSPQNPKPGLPSAVLNQMEEMVGYGELGMAKDALHLARILLKRRPVYAEVFTCSVPRFFRELFPLDYRVNREAEARC